MDPLTALFFAVLVATGWVSEWGQDVRDAIRGRGMPNHERRTQAREYAHAERMATAQHAHDRLMATEAHRHEQRMAGVGGPTIGEAVAERIRTRGPRKTRDEFGPVRGWWYDLCADRAEQLTQQRRARRERTAAGEQWWQKARDQAFNAAEWAGQRWRERHADRDPHRRWADSERTDWPDPGAPDADPVDAEVVNDRPAAAGRPPNPTPEDPTVSRVPQGADDDTPDDPPAPIRAVAERLDELPEATPAEHTNQGATMSAPASLNLSGETIDPQALLSFAQGIGSVATDLTAQIESSIANLTARGVSGAPIEHLQAMFDAAQVLSTCAQSTAGHAANHLNIQDVAHSDATVGGEQYLGIGAAAART